MSKIFLIRRKKDGKVFTYGERYQVQVADMLKTRDFELLSEVTQAIEPKAFKTVPVVEDTLECPIDGKVFVDEAALETHKATHVRTKKI